MTVTVVAQFDRRCAAGVPPPRPWLRRTPNRVPKTIGPCIMLAAVAAAMAEHPLKYRFDVGDHLVYERRATVTPLDGTQPLSRSVDQIQVWCLQHTASETLVLIHLIRSVDGRSEPARGALLYLDESGRRRLPDEIPTRLGLLDPALDVLPVLPLAVQSDAAWGTPPDLYGRRSRCTGRGPDADHHGHLRVDFEVEDAAGVADVLGQTRSGSFWFDPVRGTITRVEADEQDRRRRTRTRIIGVLRQTLTHIPRWAARRTDEAGHFLRTLRHEDRLLHEVVTRPDELPHTLAQLDRLWSGFMSDIEARAASPFLRLADARRRQLRAEADRFRARAALGRRWLNQPARPWSLQDPAGQTVISEAARQGVVIECFWSAQSVWGLRVLESLRRLTSERGVRPVRVICYNMDFDLYLARRAIKRCGKGLAHILGGPLQEVEALPEFPVVRVVDREGIVRDIWVGWQPRYTAARDLARQLAEESLP